MKLIQSVIIKICSIVYYNLVNIFSLTIKCKNSDSDCQGFGGSSNKLQT